MESVVWEWLWEEWIVQQCLQAFQSHLLSILPCSLCHQVHSHSPNSKTVDIYGQRIDNHDAGGLTVDCPVCTKAVNVCRYAPHLEKCLGLGGRNASRPKRHEGVASKTIVEQPTVKVTNTTTKKTNSNNSKRKAK